MSASSIPSMTSPKNHRLMKGVTTPTLRVRPVTRLAALVEATKPSSAAEAATRARVASET